MVMPKKFENTEEFVDVPSGEDRPSSNEVAVVTASFDGQGSVLRRLNFAEMNRSGDNPYKQCHRVIDPKEVGHGSFPKIVADNGGFKGKESLTRYGQEIVFSLQSWNETFVVAAKTKNPDIDGEFVRYSEDGKTLSDGTPVQEYLDFLKNSKGFVDAKVEMSLHLYGFVVKTGDSVVSGKDLELVVLQIPPMSVSKFKGFLVNSTIKFGFGGEDPTNLIKLSVSEVKGQGNYSYPVVSFAIGDVK